MYEREGKGEQCYNVVGSGQARNTSGLTDFAELQYILKHIILQRMVRSI